MKLELPYVQEEAVANFKVIKYFWHSLCVYAVLCKVMQSNCDDFRRFVSSKFQKRPPNERSLILLKTAKSSIFRRISFALLLKSTIASIACY